MTTIGKPFDMVIPANHIPGPRQGHWTYSHYATIPDDGTKYEVIEGVLYMSPAPSVWHQKSLMRFSYYLFHHVELKGLGEVFPAPLDVELAFHTVVQPDVLMVLATNLHKIIPSHIIAAPDLVVEIASPSTARYDRRQKLAAYQRAGVPEYWLVDPIHCTVEVLVLEKGAYGSLGTFSGEQTLPSLIVPDFPVQVELLFYVGLL